MITFNQNVDMNQKKLTGLANPTESSDAVNKEYVDGQIGSSGYTERKFTVNGTEYTELLVYLEHGTSKNIELTPPTEDAKIIATFDIYRVLPGTGTGTRDTEGTLLPDKRYIYTDADITHINITNTSNNETIVAIGMRNYSINLTEMYDSYFLDIIVRIIYRYRT